MRIRNKKLLALLGLFILAVSIPLTVFLVKQRQEIKSKAQEVQTENSPASSTTKFGFNYYPYPDGRCRGTHHTRWLSIKWLDCKPYYEKDLKIMKSFGASVLRIQMDPSSSGFVINPTCGAALGGCFNPNDSTYQSTISNLLEVMQMARDNGFEVIMAPGFEYFYWPIKPDGNNDYSTTYWQLAYGNTEQGFQRYVVDLKSWYQGIINATRNTPNLLYYDVLNEVSSVDYRGAGYARQRMWDYLKDAWDNLQNIPAGKYGISPLCIKAAGGRCAERPDDVTVLEATLSATQRGKAALNFLDFHAYPMLLSYSMRVGGGSNMNIPAAYNTINTTFPAATVILGEYAQRLHWIDSPPGLTIPQREVIQAATESAMLNLAYSTPISAMLHFQLWDSGSCREEDCPDKFGRAWGYPNNPWSVYGTMAERFSLIPNSDFEQGTSLPAGWSVGGTGATLVWGTGQSDSATGNHYGRITTNTVNSSARLTHNTITVPSTTTGYDLYVNAYLRSNMNSVKLTVVEYDGNRNRTRDTNTSAFTPTGAWQNLQYIDGVGPWKMTLLPNTRYLQVVFGGTSGTTLPATLDVDAVTLNLRNLPTVPSPTPTPTPTVSPPPPTGEYGDNVLDIRDYNAFVSCFRKKVTEVPGCEAADLNDDGLIDSSDFVLLFESFQTQSGD